MELSVRCTHFRSNAISHGTSHKAAVIPFYHVDNRRWIQFCQRRVDLLTGTFKVKRIQRAHNDMNLAL